MILVKEEFLNEEKTKRAIKLGGGDAILMWLAIKSYVSRKNSAGFVPDEAIDDLQGAPKNPRKALKVLVDCGLRGTNGKHGAGLVDKHEFGWMLHDYDDHGTPQEVEAERREKARQQKANRRAQLAAEAAARKALSAGLSADKTPDTTEDTIPDCPPDKVADSTPDAPRAGARTSARVRAPQPSPAQPKEEQQQSQPESGVMPAGKIPCPRDLRLTPDQRSTLEGSFIPGWAIDHITTKFVSKHGADPSDRRPLVGWLKCLSTAICGDWNDSSKRPRKPDAASGDSVTYDPGY